MGQDADALALAEGNILGFYLAVDQVVARLAGVELGAAQGLFHLGGIEVGNADVARLALLLQPRHGLHAGGDGIGGIPAVDLVQVHVLHLQLAQAVVHSRDNGLRAVVTADLGGQEAALPVALLEGLTQGALAAAVGLGGVE